MPSSSPPLSAQALKGKVVLVDFWTYSCINCLRSLPYVKAWADKYRADGLVVIGVHAPEFAFEKDVANVRKAVRDLGIDYPVAVDNNYAIWRAFDNHYWPAHYFIDAKGRIRHHHFGEGDYAGSERIIQQLLAEAHPGKSFGGMVTDAGKGVENFGREAGVAAQTTVEGAKDAAGSVVRIPAARVVTGHEVCKVAPNGAPDCVAAATAMCKARGFEGGKSADMTTADVCPAKVYLSGRNSGPECRTETFVSRALCQ